MKNISIAMATYNGAKFIREQLDSLIKQTMQPVELVICDDRSTDNTLEVVAEFAASSPFPVHFEKNEKQLGYPGNFMKAANLCKSELIAFCDQDDVWLPTKLEKCAATFDDPEVLLTYHNATVVDETLNPIGSLDYKGLPNANNPAQSLNPWHFALGFTEMFRRELLIFSEHSVRSVDLFHPDKRAAHDQWFFYLASCLGTIVYISEPLALYRRHGTTVSQWGFRPSMIHQFKAMASAEIEYIKARGRSAAVRAEALEQTSDKLEGAMKARAISAARGYRLIEKGCAMRQGLYGSKNIFARPTQIAAVHRLGGYRDQIQWGAGRKALIKDIVRGVLVPKYIPLSDDRKQSS